MVYRYLLLILSFNFQELSTKTISKAAPLKVYLVNIYTLLSYKKEKCNCTFLIVGLGTY